MKEKLILPLSTLIFLTSGYALMSYTGILNRKEESSITTTTVDIGTKEINQEDPSIDSEVLSPALINNKQITLPLLPKDLIAHPSDNETEKTYSDAELITLKGYDTLAFLETKILNSENAPEIISPSDLNIPITIPELNPFPSSVTKQSSGYTYIPGYETYEDRLVVFSYEVNNIYHNEMRKKIEERTNIDLEKANALMVEARNIYDPEIVGVKFDAQKEPLVFPDAFCNNKTEQKCTQDKERFSAITKELKAIIEGGALLDYVTSRQEESLLKIEDTGKQLGIDPIDILYAQIHVAK